MGLATMQDAEMLLQAERCITLWRAVVAQAMRDLSSNPRRDKDKYARISTVRWFSESDQCFLHVCCMADLQPEKILEEVGKYEY
jgi:hypothetical protein